jgi:hypothetical protein
MKQLTIGLLAVLLLAAAPADVVSDLETRGFYVEEGSTADPAAVSNAVADARNDGGRLNVVVLAEEPGGGATTFSDAVLDLLAAGTVLTVAPETVGFASIGDVWSLDELDAAVDASLGAATDTGVVETFVATLIGAPVGEAPAPSGGSLLPLLLILVAVAAVIGFFVWRSSAGRKTADAARLAEVRAAASAKLDDIANDILGLEDEIATAANEEARTFYEQASETYSEALSAAERAQTPQQLLELSTKLDEAIWQLDCAEAILDGKPPPPKPAPPPPPEVAAQPQAVPETTTPSPGYARRTTRRSSPVGSDLTQTILTMIAVGALTGRRTPFGGSWSGRTPGRTTTTRVGGAPRVRGGGRRRKG